MWHLRFRDKLNTLYISLNGSSTHHITVQMDTLKLMGCMLDVFCQQLHVVERQHSSDVGSILEYQKHHLPASACH